MHPGEIAGVRYLQTINPTPHMSYFEAMQNNIPTHHFTTFCNPSTASQIQMPSLSHNSTSDEADDHRGSMIDERKQRRMISNRESARRSRMRKQKHLDELSLQVLRLRTENRELNDKLNHVLECNDRVRQENIQLREEAWNLRRTLEDLEFNNSYNDLQGIEDVPCNTAHLRAESTNQSITNSMDFLH